MFEDFLADAISDIDIMYTIAARDAQNLGWLAWLVKIYRGCSEFSEFNDDDHEPDEVDLDGDQYMRENQEYLSCNHDQFLWLNQATLKFKNLTTLTN